MPKISRVTLLWVLLLPIIFLIYSTQVILFADKEQRYNKIPIWSQNTQRRTRLSIRTKSRLLVGILFSTNSTFQVVRRVTFFMSRVTFFMSRFKWAQLEIWRALSPVRVQGRPIPRPPCAKRHRSNRRIHLPPCLAAQLWGSEQRTKKWKHEHDQRIYSIW